MTADRIDELIALAALGELSADDRRELDDAARNDPAIRSELDDALATSASLQRPNAEEPPSGLRDAVLAAIASTPQEPAEHEPAREAIADAAPAETNVVSLAQRPRRWFSPALLAAAAVALIVVAGVAIVATDDATTTETIAAVIEAPDAAARVLSGEINGFTVTFSATEGALVVEGDGVPVPDDDETYQLWLVDDTGATSVGVFRPDDDGTVAERFADIDPSGFILGVTEEPAGGSDTPSLPILASA